MSKAESELGVLEKELEVFAEHKEKLIAEAEGKFVVIKGDKIEGCFESKADAIAQGYRQFGNSPFLVKHILRIEPIQDYISSLIAI